MEYEEAHHSIHYTDYDKIDMVKKFKDLSGSGIGEKRERMPFILFSRLGKEPTFWFISPKE